MSMNYAVRQIGDVTVLDLSGRISQGEALSLGQGRGLVLHDVVCDQAAKGHNQDPSQPPRSVLYRQHRSR